jgi:hypothetical protein
MKLVGMAMLLFASLCCPQEAGNFQPAATNVWGAQYPRGTATLGCAGKRLM